VQIPPLDNKAGGNSANSTSVGFPSEPEPAPVFEDLTDLETAYNSDPRNIDAMVALVDGYRRQQRYEDAVAVASKTSSEYPKDVMLLHMLGDIAMEGRMFDQGIQAYRDAVSSDSSPGNINKLISGLQNADRLTDALVEVDAGIAQFPDFLDFYISRGRINAILGETDAAKQDYQNYLDKAPADAVFRNEAQQAIDELSR
jgi:tetratricopeptide (TPR) repeat protein